MIGRSQRLRGVALATALLVTAPVMTLPATASAQANPSSAETKLHFQRGVKLYSEEDYKAALVEFKRAYEMSSNAAILYNLGQTQFQLRDYVGALRSFERYLATATSVAAARKQQVEHDIEDLVGRVAKVTVETSVPGAQVVIDDVVVGTSPLPAQLDVNAGIRKFAATKEGYVPASRSVEVAGGDVTRVKLKLALVPVQSTTPVASSTGPITAPPREGTHPLTYVGFGAAVAGVAVGTIFGVLALGTKSDLQAKCPGGVCPTSERGSGDSLQLQATVSTVGFGVGVVGAIVGTYFLLAGPSRSSAGASATPATASWAPWLAGSAGGVAGRF